MGLSGRKVKQRIGPDPRNLSWADDAARFGQNYLAKFGWDASQGLGVAGDGRTTHLKVSQKLDMLGIGAAHQKDPNGLAWKQNKDFEQLLQRLNAKGEVPTAEKRKHDDQDDEGEVKKKKPKPAGRHRAHRARAIAAKSMTAKSASQISEILGLASGSQTPAESSMPDTPTDVLGLQQLTTSAKSVDDYFKERLQAKSKIIQDGDEGDDCPRLGLSMRSNLDNDRMGLGERDSDDDNQPRLGLGMRSMPMEQATHDVPRLGLGGMLVENEDSMVQDPVAEEAGKEKKKKKDKTGSDDNAEKGKKRKNKDKNGTEEKRKSKKDKKEKSGTM